MERRKEGDLNYITQCVEAGGRSVVNKYLRVNGDWSKGREGGKERVGGPG